MKIGVNARFLNAPYTGIGKYTIQLFKEMAKHHPHDEFIMAVPQLPTPEVLKNFSGIHQVKIKVLGEKKVLKKIHLGLSKTFWERKQLARFFKKEKVDLIHVPYPSAFKKGNKPYIVTVHDLIPWILPEYAHKNFLSSYYQKLALKSFSKADHLFTVSEFSKRELVKFTDIPQERISLSPNACSPHYGKKLNEETRFKILQKYGVPQDKPFLFYIGGFDARKNVKKLIKTYLEYIAEEVGINLVLGGGKLYKTKLYESYDINEKIEGKNQKRGGVIKTGFIEEKDLPAFYQSALAYLNFSEYEGFNVPILEAILNGTAIICSDISVHREVAQNAAAYFDLNDPESVIAEFILKAIQDEHFLKELKNKVIAYHNQYSWEKTAKHVYGTYKKLIV